MQNESDYEKAVQVVYGPLALRLPEKERHRAFIFWITCGLGWAREILDLVEKLDGVWAGFNGKKGKDCWRLLQVKEKFGSLRFYAEFPEEGSGDQDLRARSYLLISDAENACSGICEKCGKAGKEVHPNGYWVKTLCEGCEKEVRGLKDMRTSTTGLG